MGSGVLENHPISKRMATPLKAEVPAAQKHVPDHGLPPPAPSLVHLIPGYS